MIPRHVAALLATWLLSLAAPAAHAQATETAGVYDRFRDRIVQVRVVDRQAGSKAAIGSGFFAGRPGWIVTNYHVVSHLVNEPGQYEARYVTEGGGIGGLALLAVDPVHDLALLGADDTHEAPLRLAGPPPPKGTRLWSLGYPFDIGLTIVEGTFNGMLEKSLYERLHFTGSINPGMSGGPTLDRDGSVVGVNVATAGNQVSFLVPARHVAALLEGADGEPVSAEAVDAGVSRQLLDNQDRIMGELLATPLATIPIDGYTVPGDLAPWLNCWGNSQEDTGGDLALVYHRCQSNDDIYLSASLSTGIVQFQHERLSTRALGPMRFYRQLEKRGYFPRLRLDGDEETVTNYRCQDGYVGAADMPMVVTYCVRRYRRLDGLYDAYLGLTSLTGEREALQSTLVMAGFSWDNLERFVARFLEAFSWNP